MTADVYSRVTDKIIAELEKGERPWLKPWNAEHAAGKISRPLRHNGLPYSGINVLMLWVEAMKKGSLVVYANAITKTEQNEETGEDEKHKIPFMKGYTVFNVEQIDDLPDQYYATAQAPQLEAAQRFDHAEQFFKNTGATIKHGGNRAFYTISADLVQMPPFEFFKDPESYYATLSHECPNQTKASKIQQHPLPPTEIVNVVVASTFKS